jgi:hypothetical protein
MGNLVWGSLKIGKVWKIRKIGSIEVKSEDSAKSSFVSNLSYIDSEKYLEMISFFLSVRCSGHEITCLNKLMIDILSPRWGTLSGYLFRSGKIGTIEVKLYPQDSYPI